MKPILFETETEAYDEDDILDLIKHITELEERADEYYELNEKLLAKVEELTAELNNHDYKLGKTVKALQAVLDRVHYFLTLDTPYINRAIRIMKCEQQRRRMSDD